MLTNVPHLPSEYRASGNGLPCNLCNNIQPIVIVYDAISAELKIDNIMPNASELPILIKAIMTAIDNENITEFNGIPNGKSP